MAPRYLAGAAYVQVLPSLRGFQKQVAGELRAIDVKATAQIIPQVDKTAATKAEGDVKALSERLEKARAKEADRVGRVRVAEEKLQALRAGGKATTAQLAAAEERLATATRASEQAQKTATVSAKALESAHIRHKQAVDDLEKSTTRGASALARLWQQGEGIDRMSTAMRTARRDALALAAGTYRVASGVAAIGTAVPTLVGLGSALGTATGAGLLVPGALATGVVAVGALKVGVSGLGEAMKAAAEGDATKLAEATANLAPPARAVVGEYVRMKPALDALRLDVQGRLFAGLAREVRGLGRDYLPLVRAGLVGMAGNFNTAGKEADGFLRQQQTLADVPLIFDRSTVAVGNLTAVTQPLLTVLRDVVAVGVTVLADITGGAGAAAAGVAAFIAEARASGQIEAWIRAGLDTLRQFGELFYNIGGIVNAVLGAAQEQGGGVLGTLVLLTGEIKAMLQSAEGTSAMSTLFTTLHDVVQNLLPGVQAVAGALFGGIIALGPELPALASAFSAAAVAVAPLITDLGMLAATVLPPLVSLFGWLTPALPAIAIGFAAGAVALKGYLIISKIVRFYQMWTASQVALNVAMGLNPIGLIVIAIAALVAAVVWIATQTTWFQDLWAVVWGGIQTAALTVWENALKPAFDGIVAAVRWVGDAAMWLWQSVFVPAWQGIAAAATWLWETILRPVFDALSFAARLLAAIIITVLVTPVVLAFKALAAAGSWLWENVLKPVFGFIGAAVSVLWSAFIRPTIDLIVGYVRVWAAIFSWLWDTVVSRVVDAIGTAISWLWSNVVSPVIGFIVAYVQMWGAIFSWLWTNAVQPALSAIGDAFSWLWSTVIVPVGAAISAAVAAVGDTFSWVWNNVIKPVWDALGAAISWVWETILRPVFDAIKSAVGTIGSAFDTAVNGIKMAWDRVYDILSTPIKWIIDVVYNEGIRAVWNKVAGLVGLGELSPISFGGGGSKGGRQLAMAGGGVLAGYAPGRDTVPAILSPGEAVLVPELVRAIGPATILAANAAASGRPTGGEVGFAGGGVARRFAGGGIVESLLGWLPGIGDTVKALWLDPAGFVRNQLGGLGEWAALLAKTPAKLIGSGADWLWGRIKSFFGFTSDQAASAAGAAGGRPQGWQQMWNIIRAQFPSATLNSDYRPGDPGYHGKGRAIDIGGPMSSINSWIAKVYPNSTQLIYTPGTNILNGRPFTYDAPTQADHHDHVHWAFDQGGLIPPGYHNVYNGTGKPERVLTDEQWTALTAGQDGPQRITGTLDLGHGLVGFIDGRIEHAQTAMGSALAGRRRI